MLFFTSFCMVTCMVPAVFKTDAAPSDQASVCYKWVVEDKIIFYFILIRANKKKSLVVGAFSPI